MHRRLTGLVQDTAAILAENSGRSLAGLRDAALISVMSDGLLRVSEAAALTVDDIEAEAENTITIRKSKTDQEAGGTVLYVGDPTIKRLRRWIEAAGITSGAVFVRVLKNNASVGDRALSTRAIRSIIKSRSAAAGVDNASGHSLRIGAAQSLANAGASVVRYATLWQMGKPSHASTLRPRITRRPQCSS